MDTSVAAAVPMESLPEWFSAHLWAFWLVAAVVLAGAEMITTDLTLLMLSSGALAGAVTAAFAPHAFWLQAIVAAIVATLSLVFVRPKALKRLREGAVGYRNSIAKLVGTQAITRGPISATAGQLTINGETWSARTVDDDTWIPEGALVDVYEVDGTTLVVQAVDPADRQLPPPATDREP